MNLEGVDIYEGDGAVEWQRVRAAGKSFAFIRAAYGHRVDGAVSQNFAGAKAAGLTCGLYHFFRQPQDTNSQIEAMLSAARSVGYDKGDLVPVVDVEDNPLYDGEWDPANNAAYCTSIQAWLTALQTEFGKPPIIYTVLVFGTCWGTRAVSRYSRFGSQIMA